MPKIENANRATFGFLEMSEHPQGLELDIYYPQYRFAIEVQDKQHEQHIKYFMKVQKILRNNYRNS